MKSNLSEAPRSYLYFGKAKQGHVNRPIKTPTSSNNGRNKILLRRNVSACLTCRPMGDPTLEGHMRHCRSGGVRSGWRATDVRTAAIR
jgi:hypothetical protein